MKDGDIIQIAHVTLDIEKTMKYYWENFGLGPWDVYTFKPGVVRDQMYRGKPSDAVYRLAITWKEGIQFELMQPVSGYSIYNECLERKGEGLHHLKLYFADCEAELKKYEARGIGVIQCGKIDEDVFYYLDTEKELGYVIELGNNGAIRGPEWSYPAR